MYVREISSKKKIIYLTIESEERRRISWAKAWQKAEEKTAMKENPVSNEEYHV